MLGRGKSVVEGIREGKCAVGACSAGKVTDVRFGFGSGDFCPEQVRNFLES